MIFISKKLYLFLCATLFASWAVSQPSLISFPACMIDVSFPGPPADVTSTVPGLGITVGTISGSVWQHSNIEFGKSSGQIALCSCPDEPLLSSMRNEITRTSRWNKNIKGIGVAHTSPLVDFPQQNCKSCFQMQVMSLIKNPNCFLAQFVFSTNGDSAVTKLGNEFFSSIKLSVD